MRHSRLLITLLVIATILIDLVALSFARADLERGLISQWPRPIILAFLFSMAYAQIGLLAIWVALGRSKFFRRLLVLLVVVVLWPKLLITAVQPSLPSIVVHTKIIFSYFLIEAIALILLLVCGRGLGLKLSPPLPIGADDNNNSARLLRFQYSLSDILYCMTCIAVLLGTIRYSFEPSEPIDSLFLLIPPRCLKNAPLLLAILWLILGTRSIILQAVLLIVLLVISVAISTPSHHTPLPLSNLIAFKSTIIFWTAASLAVFRVIGYRIVFKRKTSQVEPL